MKILVTGVNGQLGYDVVKRLEKENIDCIGTTKKDFDLSNENQTKKFIIEYNPDVVIHCAAYTKVDKAEKEKETCYRVNVLGTRYIAEACKEISAKIIYISTDYIFDGKGNIPFKINDTPNPVNYYGKTKYEGELEVQRLLDNYYIVRISWMFGKNGNNFIKTMLKLAKTNKEITVVSDQIGSPTYTCDLAKLLLEMIKTDKYGIYHATNEGYCTRYELAKEIFKQANLKVNLKEIKTKDYITKAIRPMNSKLDKSKLRENGFHTLENWQDSLSIFLNLLEKNKYYF